MNNQLKELADELKTHCEYDGENKLKEKNVTESTKVLHKLAKVYRQQCDSAKLDQREKKFALIRSAVLFNAALVRDPKNAVEIEDDLQELISCVLHLAEAEEINADLRKMAKVLFKEVFEMRQFVEKSIRLSKMKSWSQQSRANNEPLHFIQLSDEIHQMYTQVMKKVMDYCVKVKGQPPCKYALVGMGSLARKEITPYSDFEHIYVLEEGVQLRTDYQEILSYFRWLSVIFQLILVNMGETIIPHVSLPYINDHQTDNWFYDAFTPKGICFDGMVPFACKYPLGFSGTLNKPWKIELIKSASEMAKYLENSEDLRNGYHLADMLANTCFVSGSFCVYVVFCHEADAAFQNSNSIKQIQNIVTEDLEQFHPIHNLFCLSNPNSINIKHVFYRGVTVFVVALGRKYKIKGCSSADFVHKLVNAGKLLPDFGRQLLLAMDVACAVRLQFYSQFHKQGDVKNRNDLLGFVDGPVLFNFFKIVNELQILVLTEFDIRNCEKYTRISFPGFLTGISRINSFRLRPDVSQLLEFLLQKVGFFGIAANLDDNETFLEVGAKLLFFLSEMFKSGLYKEDHLLRTLFILNIVYRFAKLHALSTAEYFLEEQVPNVENIQDKALFPELSIIFKVMGTNLYQAGSFVVAANYFQKEIALRLRYQKPTCLAVFKGYSNLAHCYHMLGHHESALSCFRKSKPDDSQQEKNDDCQHYKNSLHSALVDSDEENSACLCYNKENAKQRKRVPERPFLIKSLVTVLFVVGSFNIASKQLNFSFSLSLVVTFFVFCVHMLTYTLIPGKFLANRGLFDYMLSWASGAVVFLNELPLLILFRSMLLHLQLLLGSLISVKYLHMFLPFFPQDIAFTYVLVLLLYVWTVLRVTREPFFFAYCYIFRHFHTIQLWRWAMHLIVSDILVYYLYAMSNGYLSLYWFVPAACFIKLSAILISYYLSPISASNWKMFVRNLFMGHLPDA